jgi:WD40 repeat protein/serine/threonine protein kinase
MAVDRQRMREAVRRLVETVRRGEAELSLEDALRMFPGYGDLVREEWAAISQAPVARTAAVSAAAATPASPRASTWPPTSPAPAQSAPPAPSAPATPADVASPSAPSAPATPRATSRPAVPRSLPPAEPGVRRIGAYRIVRELGRGGMGVVHLAEDERLGRRVALKLIAAGFAESDEVRARFRREAEAAAQLDHPGICTVYETGEFEGVPYLAMRFVEGRTLASYLADRPKGDGPPPSLELPVPGAAAKPPSGSGTQGSATRSRAAFGATLHLVEKIARAIHVAHTSGVVHRDIKPANVMVRPDGEPVVLDFGLARPEALADTGLTAPGALVGTPAYLSPEQLFTRGVPIDRRSDVYSLGVTLYECVAGVLPFSAPTLDALYQQIMTTEPLDPRKRNPAVSHDLAVVIQTAMEKDRARRYQSALDLAEDLRRVREHEPILARPVGPATRLRRWARRRPALSASLLLLLVSLLGGLATTSVQWQRADAFRRVAEDREAQAEAAAADLLAKNVELVEAERRAQAARDAARAEALVAASEAESADPMRALLLANEAARIPGALERPAVLRRLSAAAHGVTERALIRRAGVAVTSVAFAPTGERFVVGFADGDVRVHDADGEERRRIAAHGDVVSAVRFFPAGDRLLTASWDGTARIWSADGREVARLAAGDGRVLTASVSGDGSLVATAHEDGAARLWSPDGTLRATLAGHRGWVTHVRFSPDGARVATCATDWVVRTFDRGGALLREHRGHTKRITAAEFLADGRLVTTALDGSLRVWSDAEDGPPAFETEDAHFDLAVSGTRVAVAGQTGVHVLEIGADGAAREVAAATDQEVRRVAFVPRGDGLVLGDERGTVRLWETSAAASRPVCAHGGTVVGLSFAPDGATVLSAGLDETARLTDLRGAGHAVVGGAGSQRVWTAHCSPTRDEFVTGHDDGTVRVHAFDGQELAVLRGHAGAVVCVRFAPDGASIVSGSADRTARVWSRDGRLLATLDGHAGAVFHVRWSPDSRHVLTACGDPAHPPRVEGEAFPRGSTSTVALGARVWTADGRALAAVEPDGLVNCAEFLPGGEAFVVGTGAAYVHALDGRLLATLPDHEGRLGAVAVSPDGQRIATSGPDLKVRICGVDGRPLREVRGNWYFVGGLAWAPTGRRLLATGPGHLRASVWDEDGRMLVSLGPCDELVARAEFSHDGRRIAAASFDRTARVWDIGGEELAVLRGHGDAVLGARFSRDGRHVVTFSADGTARSWAVNGEVLRDLGARRATRTLLPDERVRYAEILGLDPELERAAKRLVESTLARLPLPEDAARDVAADPSASPELRERALALLAESRVDPEILASVAWFDVRDAGRPEADYRRGLRWLDAAARIAPSSVWRLPLYRGVALFRLGRLEDARREVQRNLITLESAGQLRNYDDWFVLAMIAHRAGDTAALDRELARLRPVMADPDTRVEDDNRTLAEFVQATGIRFPLEPAAPTAPPRPVEPPR